VFSILFIKRVLFYFFSVLFPILLRYSNFYLIFLLLSYESIILLMEIVELLINYLMDSSNKFDCSDLCFICLLTCGVVSCRFYDLYLFSY